MDSVGLKERATIKLEGESGKEEGEKLLYEKEWWVLIKTLRTHMNSNNKKETV